MHPQLAFAVVILSWPVLYAIEADALAIAPQGSIITAINRTQVLSNINVVPSQGLPDETFTPSQNFIEYPVPHSPTTLLFHGFGGTIPINELLKSVALAIGIIMDYLDEGKGKVPISKGLFQYTHEFLNDNEIGITVADFSETDRPITYFILRDVLRGIGEFTLMEGQRKGAHELQFEVQVKKMGYLGTGHVHFKPGATATSSVARLNIRPTLRL